MLKLQILIFNGGIHMDVIIDVISQVGFPIAVSVWLLYQNQHMLKSLDANTDAINKLSERLNKKNDEL